MSDTLLQLAQEELAAATQAVQDAQAALAAANAEAEEARAQLAVLTEHLAGLQATAARLRRDLARAESHADADAILDQLDENQIEARRTAAQILELGTALADAEAGRSRAGVELGRAGAARAAATAEVAGAQPAEDRRAKWRTKADALAATLQNDANAVKGGAAYTAARTRVEADVPAALRTSGRARATAARTTLGGFAGAVTTAENAVRDDQQDDHGSAGVAAARQIELARADAALGDLALRAEADLAAVRAVLAAIQTAPPLSDAVKARITALAAEGGPAVTELPGKRTARNNAKQAVDAKQAQIAAKNAEIAAAGMPTPQVLLDDLAALQAQLPPLQAALQLAQQELDAMRAKVDAWVEAVPEAAWKRLLAFDEATRTLDRLAATNPATIKTAAVNAEKAYATALGQARADARHLAEAKLDLEEALRARAASIERRDALLLAALRGDN